MKYRYDVILNGELGDFLAQVKNAEGEVIHEVNGHDLVGGKFTGHPSDLLNLQEQLIEKGVIGDGDVILPSDEFELLAEDDDAGARMV